MTIHIDFEYNRDEVLLCCAEKVVDDQLTHYSFDFRNGKDNEKFGLWLVENIDEVFVSYAAHAEMTSFLRLGYDPSYFKWIDLMVECRMITMSHRAYFTADSSFTGQIRALLKRDVAEQKEVKDKMRDLILDNFEWTDDQWSSIVEYCWSDVYPMKELLNKVISVHRTMAHPYKLDHALGRSKYICMTAEMDFASKGFPVHGPNLKTLYSRRSELKNLAVKSLPMYFRVCYEKNAKGGWTLKQNKLTELVTARKWALWPKTETGKVSTALDVLEDLEVQIPEIKELIICMKSLRQLSSTDLSTMEKDGYIKSQTFTFTSVTGRNGLRQTKGYMLNFPKWMHKLIKPHPDMCFLGADWSQQEVGLAAALSGDTKLLEAYKSGDIYLALGKMAGQIPPDGTKKTHGAIRDIFKALQLALAYGKGVKALANDLHGIMSKSGSTPYEAFLKAKEVYAWHKATFKTYWEWANGRVLLARRAGWIESKDHWVEWVDAKTKTTQLLNFPSQSGGAAMMRVAYGKFYEAWKSGEMPPVLVSQHDAFYFNEKTTVSEKTALMIEKIMSETGVVFADIEIKATCKVFSHEQGYSPDHWEPTWETMWSAATKPDHLVN